MTNGNVIIEKLISYKNDRLSDFLGHSRDYLKSKLGEHCIFSESGYNSNGVFTDSIYKITCYYGFVCRNDNIHKWLNNNMLDLPSSDRFELIPHGWDESNKTYSFLVREKSLHTVFGVNLTGGYGRSYNLKIREDTCDLTGGFENCLIFDSSDGEYAELCMGLNTIDAISSVFSNNAKK